MVLREIFAKYISTNTAFLESGFQSKSIPFQIQNLTDSNHNKKNNFQLYKWIFSNCLQVANIYFTVEIVQEEFIKSQNLSISIYLQIYFVLLFTKTDTSLLKVYSSQETFS